MADKTTKLKRLRLNNDKDFLKKLVSLLDKEKLTKEELAEKLGIDNVKKISDSVLLAAVKLAGDSSFLTNIAEKTSGRVKKGPHYSAKRGLVIPARLLEEKGIADGQKYKMSFGNRKGIITLTPVDGDL